MSTPKTVWLATNLLSQYGNPTEPMKYPNLFTEMIEKSAYDKLADQLANSGRQDELETSNAGLATEIESLKGQVASLTKENEKLKSKTLKTQPVVPPDEGK